MYSKYLIFEFLVITGLVFFSLSCEREWDNIWDENIVFNPESWAPSDLQITPISATSATISWQDNSNGEEGFKIDRKINQGGWQVDFAIIDPNITYFTDHSIDLQNFTYTYRIYAFKDSTSSARIEKGLPIYCFDSRDEQFYETIQIGVQQWMKENLAYLPSVSPFSVGSPMSTYYYVYAYEGTNVIEAKASINFNTYGVLYNWAAAKTSCPNGWHLPSDDEWSTLVNFLEGDSAVGGKLKEAGTAHWNSPNTGATNSSGFTALPGGMRNGDGSISTKGHNGCWWSSTEPSTSIAYYRMLYYENDNLYRYNVGQEYGFSVRCLRDN